MQSHIRSFLIVFTILAVFLPVAIIITLFLYPFWLWLESTFSIEAVGHSGPSEWCYWVVYFICVALSLFTYFRLGINKIILGLIVFLGLLLVILILLPLPHGGSLGMSLLHEITDVVRDIPKKNMEANERKIEYDSKKKELHEKLSNRFAGPLEFKEEFHVDHWRSGTVLDAQAWLDTKTGIIWGAHKQTVLAGWGEEGLKFAINYCQNLIPKGFWSLPTNAEFALGVKSKMQNYINNLSGKWIAQLYNSSLIGLNPMPSLVGFANQGVKNIASQID